MTQFGKRLIKGLIKGLKEALAVAKGDADVDVAARQPRLLRFSLREKLARRRRD